MTQLRLHSTHASGLLLPARIDQAFLTITKLTPSAPDARMHGQELRFAKNLSLQDDATVGFVLEFGGQGARVEAEAHGPSADLLRWAFHSIAATLKCELSVDDAVTPPSPAEHLSAAAAYVEAYDADVVEGRMTHSALDGSAFVAWLALEEHVALVPNIDPATFEELPMNDAPQLYELLLESDAIDDVFVSERDVARLLSRFNARKG